MVEEVKPVKEKKTGPSGRRPVLLTIASLFAMVFFTVIAALFGAALAGAEWIARVTNQYVQHDTWSAGEVGWLFTMGLILHLAGLTGVILIWFMKKAGYLLMGISCLIIALFQLFNPQFTVATVAAYILLILFFGLFYRRFH